MQAISFIIYLTLALALIFNGALSDVALLDIRIALSNRFHFRLDTYIFIAELVVYKSFV